MKKMVVFFDICSSSKIIEDLSMDDSIKYWRQILKIIGHFLVENKEIFDYKIYKFLGDGWILIIHLDTHPNSLLEFFKELCILYKQQFQKKIKNRLSVSISPIGLTFGLDIGEIYSIKLNDRFEYVGTPLNIAARLQNSLPDQNDKGDDPSNQLMMQWKYFYEYFREPTINNYKFKKVQRTLKNIKNADTFQCSRIWLT